MRHAKRSQSFACKGILVGDAPGDLQARLGASASNYQAQYPYMFPPGIYDVPPTIDPGPGIPNGGVAHHSNKRSYYSLVGMASAQPRWWAQQYVSVVAAM